MITCTARSAQDIASGRIAGTQKTSAQNIGSGNNDTGTQEIKSAQEGTQGIRTAQKGTQEIMSAQDIDTGRIAGTQKTSAQNIGSDRKEGTQEIEISGKDSHTRLIEISGKDSHTRLIETSESDQVNIGSRQQAQLQVSDQQYRVNKDQAQLALSVQNIHILYDPGKFHSHSRIQIRLARYLHRVAILLGGCYGLLSAALGLRTKSQPVGILISKSFRFKVFGEPAIAAMATVD